MKNPVRQMDYASSKETLLVSLKVYEIFHHSAVKGITGSCHELNKNQDLESILIDCGLFQGAKAELWGGGLAREKCVRGHSVADTPINVGG